MQVLNSMTILWSAGLEMKVIWRLSSLEVGRSMELMESMVMTFLMELSVSAVTRRKGKFLLWRDI